MPKNVIFCADGTWNGPQDRTGESVLDGTDTRGELQDASVTNVVKLFANLAGQVTAASSPSTREQEKRFAAANETRQVAKYLHGVGDSANPIVRLLGGAFGAGVIARIVRGYTFISRNYAAGDLIYIVGFSRGAYTARALAGMIARVGLLNPRKYDLNDKETAYRLGASAWAKSHSIAVSSTPIEGLRDLLDHVVNRVESWVADSLSPDSLLPNIPIKAVAVWDTVGSYGIPEYVKNQRIDLFRFVDHALSPRVERGFHAMSIDERRIDFPVTRWDRRDGITEQWFVGAHADVGGGYPPTESGLSDVALAWMSERLGEVGVLYDTSPAYVPATDRYRQPIHTPWNQPPFDLLGQSPRTVVTSDPVDPTVRLRLAQDPNYRPEALERWLAANPLGETAH